VPVWLFATSPPPAETAALCERIYIQRGALRLLFQAERRLWPVWVALAVAPWTGEPGRWSLKLAPLLVPPFHALLVNENGGFFHGSPGPVCRHVWHRLADGARRLRNAIATALHDLADGARHLRDRAALAWARLSDIPRAAWVHTRDVAAAVLFKLFAWLLRGFGYPQHGWFQRLHGREPLQVPRPRRHANGLVRFAQHGPDWNGAALQRLADADGVRWLVWHRNGAQETIEDLLPLFEDQHTFAVSRQSHFGAWKPGMFPTAPFRPLQPDEACRVLAPLGDTIVVDLPKLAALGIPRNGLAGTAWLELFWKAAAAGWASYSVGQAKEVAQQPDLPMETAQFFWRVLRNPRLRRLGAQEPDLARGNIAFAHTRRRERAAAPEKLRVLVVSPFLPYPLSHGGAVRIYNLCRALADRVDFFLAAVRERHDAVNYPELHSIFREVRVVDRDELPSNDERLPHQVRQYQSRSLTALVAELAQKWKPDLMQVEYTHMAGFRSSAPHIPAVLVEHDVTFTLYRQLYESRPDEAARREFERWREFESKWLAAFDAVWTVSDDDRSAAIQEGSPPERTFVVPNGVDLTRFQPRPGRAPAPEILYVGSFRHLPNILGFEKLRSEIMPRVWERFPELRLRVVAGPDHEKFWRDLTGSRRLPEVDRRIAIEGFVEDVAPLYADALAVVVPLEVSAGTNIKVLEAMASGKAIVTTPVGSAGLDLRDGSDAMIRADWMEFASAIGDVVSSAELRKRLGDKARRAAEARFGWRAIAERALTNYEALAQLTGCP